MNQRRHLTVRLPVRQERGMNLNRDFQLSTHIKSFSGSPEDKSILLDREEGEIDSEEGGGDVSKKCLNKPE